MGLMKRRNNTSGFQEFVIVHGNRIEVQYPYELNLQDTHIKNISEIKGLDKCKIKTLDLSRNQITEIQGLEYRFLHLQTLDLSGNQIVEITGLEHLYDLQTLDLSGNRITEIQGLENETIKLGLRLMAKFRQKRLKELRKSVYISEKIRQKLLKMINEPLDTKKDTKLTKLRLSRNQIAKLKGLEYMVNLEELDLGHNQIQEITGLGHLKNLQVLNLGGNQITHVKGLEELTSLKSLRLSRNRIKEIKGLENLVNLEELDLGHNQIQEITGLESLINLQILELNKNPLKITEQKFANEAISAIKLCQTKIIEGVEQSLPSQTHEVPNSAKPSVSEGSCVICAKVMSNNDKVQRCKECGYFFHLDCILEWVINEGHKLCPRCSGFLGYIG